MKKKKYIKKFTQTRCPFGHELYSVSITSSTPFCPVCGWYGDGSLFTKNGKKYWEKCSKKSYVDWAVSNSTGEYNKIGIIYEKNSN